MFRKKGVDAIMKNFTEKEADCLLEYTKDLLALMKQENLNKISDNIASYTQSEIQSLSDKLKKIND